MRAEFRVESAEAEIARREVEFFEEQRIVRDVHLAVEAEQRPVGVDDRGRIVIQTRSALLEQRRDNHHAQFLRERAQSIGGRPGNGFRQIEQPRVFLAAEILRAEQFLQADDLRALSGGFAHFAGADPDSPADRAHRPSAPAPCGIFRWSQNLF